MTEREDVWASTSKYSTLSCTLTSNLFQQGFFREVGESSFTSYKIVLPPTTTSPPQPLHPKFSSHISFSERLLFCIFFLLFPREQLPDTSILPLVFSEAGNTVQIPSFPPFLPFCSSFHSTHPLIISVYFSWFSVLLHFSYRHTSLSELIQKNSLEIALSICEFCFLWSLFSDIAFISICTPAQLILQSTDLVLELWYN